MNVKVLVYLSHGAIWSSDQMSVTHDEILALNQMLDQLGELNTFNITMGGQKIFINPAHIVAVEVQEQ